MNENHQKQISANTDQQMFQMLELLTQKRKYLCLIYLKKLNECLKLRAENNDNKE